MSRTTTQEYLQRMRGRYARLRNRVLRSAVLSEFCATSGYERKHAIKLLRGRRGGPSAKKRGRRGRCYGAAEASVLRKIWLASEQPCGKRMRAVLTLWLPAYEKREGPLDAAVRARLQRISAAQIDRLLRRSKAGGKRRPRAGTGAMAQVPLRERPATATEPGWVQMDTVWHCGESTRGSFVCSLTAVDTCTQWTELRAMWNHSERSTLERIGQIEAALPFALKGCHTDNGTEFLNWSLWRYLRERPQPVEQTRSRPYRKNDNAHAEQKNRVLIRQLAGYERMDFIELAEALDGVLQLWSLWNNLFAPTLKLLEKRRQGARWIKVYERQPRTPCQRLLDQEATAPWHQERLRELLERHDPFTLREQIEQRHRALHALWEELKSRRHNETAA